MRRFLASWLAVATLVAVLCVLRFGPAIAVAIGFLSITPLELVFRRHAQPVRRPGLRTDVLHLLFTGLVQGIATLVGVGAAYVLLHRFTITASAAWLQQTPRFVQYALGVVVFEIFGYWYHRWSHELPFLWRFHAVHHSSERLDWLSAARLHPLEGFFSGLVVGPAFVVLGFRPVAVPVVTTALTVWAILLHANVRWRLGTLDGIVTTPEYHHWHHSNHAEARNHNYSGLLPVLDRIFGTYYQPVHRRPEVYGVDSHVPDGWFAQLLHPFRRASSPVTPF